MSSITIKVPVPLSRQKKYLRLGILVALAILALLIGWLIFHRLRHSPAAAESQTAATIQDVAQIIELPLDEEPVFATVSDVNKLKDQAFFAKAQNGDKVLFYAQARKAILYRPSTRKVIEVSTLNLDQVP